MEYLVIDRLKESLVLIKRNPLRLAYPVLVDLIFLFIYGFLSYFIFLKIDYYMSSIFEQITQNTAVFEDAFVFGGLLSAVKNVPGTDVLLKKAFLWILALAVLSYILYCVFQAVSWRLSINIAKKGKIKQYMKRFFLVNIVWAFLFAVYNALAIFIGYRKEILSRYFEVSDFSLLLVVFGFVLIYFALISYSLIARHKAGESLKKTFVFGVKKIKYFLPMYLILFIAFLIINLIMTYSSSVGVWLYVVLGVFVLLPFFAWARVYAYLVVEKIS